MNIMTQQIQEDAIDLNIRIQPIACKRKQESVDKVIIADIGSFASECAWKRSIGHIVLISGDRDYSHILSSYANKPYIGQIILFHHEQTNDKLKSNVNKSFCLFYDPNKINTEQKENDNDNDDSVDLKSYKNRVVGGSVNGNQWPSLKNKKKKNKRRRNKKRVNK